LFLITVRKLAGVFHLPDKKKGGWEREGFDEKDKYYFSKTRKWGSIWNNHEADAKAKASTQV